MAPGELFAMITGIRMMLALLVANWDFLMLLVPLALHTSVMEAVKFGLTTWVVPAVKVQLKIVPTQDGA